MIRSALLSAVALALGLGGASRLALALDLPAVLREVRDANPTLAARRQMAEAARYRIGPAGAWQSPMLELGPVNVPTSGSFNAEPMTMKMIGVTQRVPLFGANRLSAQSARAAASAETSAVSMTRYDLFGMAVEAYADAYFAAALRGHAEGHIGAMARLVESARARYAAGTGRLDDVLRAQAEQARTLTDLEAFRGEERGAYARLDALRGVDPGLAPDTLAVVALKPVPADPSAWLAAVTDTLPRLSELKAQTAHYDFAARAARRMVWPDLELKYSYGFREELAGGIPQDNMWSASVGFMVPIFAGQREFSEGAEMDAMARASAAERRAAELDLRQRVAETYAVAVAAQRTVRLYADTVVTVEERAVDASWVSYSTGSTDLWRVLEATHALYTEVIALARARQDLMHAQARMLSLTGRADLLGIALPEAEETRR